MPLPIPNGKSITAGKPVASAGNGNRVGSGLPDCLEFFDQDHPPFFITTDVLDPSFDLCYRQIYTPSAVKAMHSAAKKSPALRVVLFASALPASPTRKCFASIKGQKRVLAELDWRTDLFNY